MKAIPYPTCSIEWVTLVTAWVAAGIIHAGLPVMVLFAHMIVKGVRHAKRQP